MPWKALLYNLRRPHDYYIAHRVIYAMLTLLPNERSPKVSQSRRFFMVQDEPEEQIGRWRTYCNTCEWSDQMAHLYQSECGVDKCPECDSEDVVDVNEDEEA